MKDRFNREINYLRISVTDLCNLRCTYCMPEKGVCKKEHSEIISIERIEEIVKAAQKAGISKVRLTGGEPLVRKGIIEICEKISNIFGIKELCLTTNGVLLKGMAQKLYDAGVNRLNISLDTLNKNKYKSITRGGDINQVLEGLKAAKEVGFKNTKINVVLIHGFNDDEIENFIEFARKEQLYVRFIELMPIGEGKRMGSEAFLSNHEVLKHLHNTIEVNDDGVSKQFKFKDQDGGIGLISPISDSFCKNCSRLRLTSDGKLRPCLHSSLEIDTKDLHNEELINAIREAILQKPEKHHLETGSGSNKTMNEIGG